jgi:hypothetical protein
MIFHASQVHFNLVIQITYRTDHKNCTILILSLRLLIVENDRTEQAGTKDKKPPYVVPVRYVVYRYVSFAFAFCWSAVCPPLDSSREDI